MLTPLEFVTGPRESDIASDASQQIRDAHFPRAYDHLLLCGTIGFLILSTADAGLLGSMLTAVWLASFAMLAVTNIGGAIAAYIGALAIYSPLHFEGVSVSQRPDNLALVILTGGMILLAVKRSESRPSLFNPVLAFVLFAVLHGALLSPATFAALFRAVLVPLLLGSLAAMVKLHDREMHAMQNGLAFLGSYMGLVSVAERVSASDWILPPWISDTSLRPFDEFLDGWIGSGRSGGILLQPAWNGLLLSLIASFLLVRMRQGRNWTLKASVSMCIVGSFFTYTRGVWLGLALSLIWFPGWCRSVRQLRFRRVALVGAGGILLLAAGSMASERLQDSNTVYYRLNLWGAALRMFAAHPLFGVGFFNFGTAMAGTEQGFGALMSSQPDVEEGVASHNTVLTIIAEFGFVGFALYAWAFYGFAQAARRNITQYWGPAGGVWALAFATVYLTNAQFVSAFEGTTNVALFSLFGAMAGARLKPTSRR